jgi:hypothetical protein
MSNGFFLLYRDTPTSFARRHLSGEGTYCSAPTRVRSTNGLHQVCPDRFSIHVTEIGFLDDGIDTYSRAIAFRLELPNAYMLPVTAAMFLALMAGEPYKTKAYFERLSERFGPPGHEVLNSSSYHPIAYSCEAWNRVFA